MTRVLRILAPPYNQPRTGQRSRDTIGWSAQYRLRAVEDLSTFLLFFPRFHLRKLNLQVSAPRRRAVTSPR